MANRRISPDEFAVAISAELTDFLNLTVEEMQESAKKIADQGVQKLKADSPKNTGKYAKGWRKKIVAGRLKVGTVLYQGNRPSLTHLLEKPHQLRNGGMSKPQVHIKPVEEWACREYESDLKRRISGK